jgi:hypothetical protein
MLTVVDADGMTANGTVATAAGPVPVKAPRVNDKRVDPDTGERRRSSSAIPPAWARKTPKISEASVRAGAARGAADGRRELITLDSGYGESGESWASLLRDAARRGMRAPGLAVGDGALGFRKALREVFPETRE